MNIPLLIVFLIDSVYLQRITFLNLTNVYNTECKQALIHGKDYVLYFAEIDLQNCDYVANIVYVEFERVFKNSEYTSFCSIDLPKCESTPICKCNNIKEKTNVFIVTINITALPHLSRNKIRGKIHCPTVTYSEERRISVIYDPDKKNVTFSINEKVINTENCSATVYGPTLAFKVIGEDLDVIPTQLEIYDEARHLITKSKNNMANITNVQEKISYAIKYVICDLPSNKYCFDCTITRADVNVSKFSQETVINNESKDLQIPLIVSVLVNIILGFYIYKLKTTAIKKKLSNKDYSQKRSEDTALIEDLKEKCDAPNTTLCDMEILCERERNTNLKDVSEETSTISTCETPVSQQEPNEMSAVHSQARAIVMTMEEFRDSTMAIPSNKEIEDEELMDMFNVTKKQNSTVE